MYCALIGVLILSGCVSSSSIASLNDRDYFKESPKIVTYEGRYFMRFVYPDPEGFVFFMMADSKVNNDSLIYYLPVTTSSGNMRGRVQFQETVKANEIEIIKKNRVFWEEPNGSLVAMDVGQLKAEEIGLLPK